MNTKSYLYALIKRWVAGKIGNFVCFQLIQDKTETGFVSSFERVQAFVWF